MRSEKLKISDVYEVEKNKYTLRSVLNLANPVFYNFYSILSLLKSCNNHVYLVAFAHTIVMPSYVDKY